MHTDLNTATVSPAFDNSEKMKRNSSQASGGQGGLLVSFGGAGGNYVTGRNSSRVGSSNTPSGMNSIDSSMEKDKRITLAQIAEADLRQESSTVVGIG